MHATLTRRGAVTSAVTALTLVGGVLLASPAAAAGPYDGKTVISAGHTDVLFVSEESGQAILQIHDDTGNPQHYVSPSDVVFHVKPSVATRTANAWVANGIPGFTTVGATVYVLPQSNMPGQIFAGFGHSLPSGSSITHEITAFTGPGNFATWQSGEEGPIVFFNQAAGLPTSFTSPANHEHLNWGFTAEGEYKLTITATATKPDSTVLTSTPQVYTFFVGEELPDDGEPPADTTLTIEGAAAHYHAGGVVRFSAVATPASDSDHYHWFSRAPGETEWTVVPDATSAGYGFIARAADSGREYIARLYGEDEVLIAESAPVTMVVDDHGNPPVEGQTITATLPEGAGSLVISVAPGDHDVTLTDFALNQSADRYVATGALNPVTVTDTRTDNAGWTASGRVRAFTTIDGKQLTGNHLGWAPEVLSTVDGQTVAPGPQVSSVLSGGAGIAGWSILGTAG